MTVRAKMKWMIEQMRSKRDAIFLMVKMSLNCLRTWLLDGWIESADTTLNFESTLYTTKWKEAVNSLNVLPSSCSTGPVSVPIFITANDLIGLNDSKRQLFLCSFFICIVFFLIINEIRTPIFHKNIFCKWRRTCYDLLSNDWFVFADAMDKWSSLLCYMVWNCCQAID